MAKNKKSVYTEIPFEVGYRAGWQDAVTVIKAHIVEVLKTVPNEMPKIAESNESKSRHCGE